MVTPTEVAHKTHRLIPLINVVQAQASSEEHLGKICNHCEQPYQEKDADQLYCSSACVRRARKARKKLTIDDAASEPARSKLAVLEAEDSEVKICDHCEEKYVSEQESSKYCSRKCSQKSKRRRRATRAKEEESLHTDLTSETPTPAVKEPLVNKRSLLDCQWCHHKKALLAKDYCSERCYQLAEMHEHQQEEYIDTTYRIGPKKKFTVKAITSDPNKVRDNERKRDIFDVRCPRPWKKVYRTEEEAIAFINRVHSEEKDLKPYSCRCGALHIGHPDKRNTHQRIQPHSTKQVS